MAILQAVSASASVGAGQQLQPTKTIGEVAWMPLNSDWPTWLQQLYFAVQEAQSCYTELGEASCSRIAAVQQPGVGDLQTQAYELWQSLEQYVKRRIEDWEHALG